LFSLLFTKLTQYSHAYVSQKRNFLGLFRQFIGYFIKLCQWLAAKNIPKIADY
jgi:hypothetical protein